MKYNPKINDRTASLFADLHPRQSYQTTQGVLALAYELEQMLAKITGMDFVTLQPAAGAQSELTALLMFKAYHAKRGDAKQARRIIVPDSAHGTNPASAAMCGYQVTTVKSDARGNVDLEALKAALGPDVAGFMLTNPNTLGLFEGRVREVCAAVHDAGGLVYGDGANMNALLGVARPGDLGFDCVHINVHKTFSTPHGAGGPGAGPLCVKAQLRPFLPKPWIVREADGSYHYDTAREDRAPAGLGDSIGTIKQRIGNFGVLVRAYTYMKTLGEEGMVETGRDAILAANYLLALLRPAYDLAYDRPPMHEFVLSASKQKKQGASALDVSKALLDEDSERIDQAHYGERLTLLTREDDWFYAQGPDHYFGWVQADHLDEVGAPERRIVGVVVADVRSAPTDAAPIIDRLPVAAPLAIPERPGDWIRLRYDGWVPFRDPVDLAQLASRFPVPADLLRTAECFLGVPYLWGGTTADGIDCSGFTQLVYRLNGVGLDRDADQQAMEGRSVHAARAG